MWGGSLVKERGFLNKMSKKYFAVLAAVLSLSLAACGESDSSSSAETTTTTAVTTTTAAPAEDSSVPDESSEESSEDTSDTETTTTTTVAESEPETTTTTSATTVTTTTTTTTTKKTSTTTTAKPQPTVKILASGNCGDKGDNVKWTFDENGTVTITGKGKMAEYYSALYAIEEAGIDLGTYNEKVKKAVVGNGVENIPTPTFHHLSKIEEISLPNTITEIGDYSFNYCGIQNIVIPNSVKTIGSNAFTASGLKKVTIPSSVKTIGFMAFCYTPLEEVILSEGIETIENAAFTACPRLKSVTIPASVKTIGDEAFGFTQVPREENNDGWDHNFIIKGKAGSAAEKYAKDNNLKFVAI